MLNDQQSCVINRGFATQYLTLKRGARQGDPVSVYLFTIALEVLFCFNQKSSWHKMHWTVQPSFLFTANTDDSTFFVKYISSVKILVETFK